MNRRRLILFGVLAVVVIIIAVAVYVLVIRDDEEDAEVSADLSAAQEALTRYFTLLHEGNYAEAAELYGGAYDTLTEWNPDANPDDHAALFELGCTVNGLQCLPVREVVASEETASGAFQFTVTFETADGEQFVLDAAGEATSEFVFTVVKVGDAFQVQELPVYES